MSNPMIPPFYETHVENVGWLAPVSDGQLSGTVGRSLSIEAIKIYFNNIEGLGVRYATYIENSGWQDWVADGAISGTVAQSLRMEAIKIELTGVNAELYSIQYRVHVQDDGWQDWFKDGAVAGTTGEALRAEGIEIVVTYKNANITIANADKARLGVAYASQIENIGWRTYLRNGASGSGTGSGLRLEAVKVKLEGVTKEDVGVRYRSHVQNIGWQDWVENDAVSGTEGQGLRLEAFEAVLFGADAAKYSIWYSVDTSEQGWTELVRDGATCGTTGKALGADSIRILITLASEDLTQPVNNEVKNSLPYREIFGFEYPADQFVLHSPRLDINLVDPIITEQLNKTYKLTFTITPNHKYFNSLKKMKTYILIYETDVNGVVTNIFDGRVLNEELTLDLHKKITCEGSMGFLRDNIQRPNEYLNVTYEEWMALIVNVNTVDMGSDKRFHMGQFMIDSIAEQKIPVISNDYTTTMELLESQLTEYFGGYFVPRNTGGMRYLDYVSNVGVVSTQRVDFGKNIMALKKVVTTESTYTAIIPVGKDGLTLRSAVNNYNSDYIYDPVALDQYGFICKVVYFDDVDDWATLYIRAALYLNQLTTTTTTIELNAFDCGLINVDISRIRIGDSVRCVSPLHGLDEFLLVSKRVTNINNPELDEMTLGEPTITNSEMVAKQKKKMDAAYQKIMREKTELERTTLYNLLGV